MQKSSADREIDRRMALVYAFVAHRSDILAEHTDFGGNFKSIAYQYFLNLPLAGSNFAYHRDGHTFSYLVDNDFTYCIVTEDIAGRLVPLAFLELIKHDFISKYDVAAATTHGLDEEYGPKLKDHMQYCVDNPEEVSKLAALKAERSDVTVIVEKSTEDRVEKWAVLDKDSIGCIRLRLPVKSICRFKTVSKEWCETLSSPEFISSHLMVSASNVQNHSIIISGDTPNEHDLPDQYGPVVYHLDGNNVVRVPVIFKLSGLSVRVSGTDFLMVGSVNGLICVAASYTTACSVWIWNPATQRVKDLGIHKKTLDWSLSMTYHTSLGFGFDSTTGNYVVVWIVGVKHEDKDETYWEVYSSLTDSWKVLMFDLNFYPHKGRNEVIVGGVPYWIGSLNNNSNLLLRYNVKEDRFEQIPLPELPIGQLVEWKSSLANISVEEDKMTMTIYDEESRGWKTTLTLGPIAVHINRPIQTLAYGQILFQNEEGVVLLDPQNNNRQVLCHGVLNSYAFQHIESMVHLDGMRGLDSRDGLCVFKVNEWRMMH